MNDQQNTPRSAGQSIAIPIAIIIGFGLIAAAIYFSGTTVNTAQPDTQQQQAAEQAPTPEQGTINPITEEDHIRGNPNASIVIVEYSDFDCPFCKSYHETMTKIMSEYGADGRVAWVYRHLPLEQLHPSAPYIAEASECVAKLGGNEAFWTFSDLVFGEREVNEPTNTTRLDEFATTAGVNIIDFNACLTNGDTKAAVQEDVLNGASIGAQGTPYSVVVVGDEQGIINGAQPYDVVRQIIDNLLDQIEG